MEMEEENNTDGEEDMVWEGNRILDISSISGESDNEPQDEGDREQFDITLAASHSYMDGEVWSVRGGSVVEAGWEGRVPALACAGCVFPGETVPLLLADPADAACMQLALQADKLFALLFTDMAGGGAGASLGVLCEVFEAGAGARGALQVKARAVGRVRCAAAAARAAAAPVRLLPDAPPRPPLLHARLAALDGLRRGAAAQLARRMDAALTPWPAFVYEMCSCARLRARLVRYFASAGVEARRVPREPVALSWWVAANLPMSRARRRALFAAEGAALRLRLAARAAARLARRSRLACVRCGRAVAERSAVFAMSSAGVQAHYTNPGGALHSVVTVRAARGAAAAGAASRDYSWFPGYAWEVAACAHCGVHVGWRFSACEARLAPAEFYGLCRDRLAPALQGQSSTVTSQHSSPASSPRSLSTSSPRSESPLGRDPLPFSESPPIFDSTLHSDSPQSSPERAFQ